MGRTTLLAVFIALVCAVHGQTYTVKDGKCPAPRYTFRRGCSSWSTHNCSRDSDCSGEMKCCRGFVGEDCSVCRFPEFSNSTVTTTRQPLPKPTNRPHRDHHGTCPNNFEKYHWYDDFGITCENHCNSSDDCAEGELCCVEESGGIIYDDLPVSYRKRRQVDGSRCPVCKKANYDCYGTYGTKYSHGEMYMESYYDSSDYCRVCQCYYGQSNCFYICGDDYMREHFWAHGWFAAGISAGVALLISVIFTLSLCCCLKCCCSDKKQTIVLQQRPAVAQQPGNVYYMSPPKEEKLPLAENGYTTA
ncbi:uncharacterized protein LOC110978173 isoform X2 [Acanthaster planci]|uniref:Uncharacterized protein LOC110978173 isoform X2 n=1 Tax=Acanthaster planci TaxID=133434 RepID=A0A8B7YAC6_ACAPL|nr:uncharacterized protein LOC110978173 isoform X2 [Acanthaster planci]